jgi:hypothetical protein
MLFPQLASCVVDFRRSIVTSTETPNTIVDESIRELDKLNLEPPTAATTA